jgi:hypothetical protein
MIGLFTKVSADLTLATLNCFSARISLSPDRTGFFSAVRTKSLPTTFEVIFLPVAVEASLAIHSISNGVSTISHLEPRLIYPLRVTVFLCGSIFIFTSFDIGISLVILFVIVVHSGNAFFTDQTFFQRTNSFTALSDGTAIAGSPNIL